ncbi:MAG TPA: hypothetical protein VF897_01585, partial [Roseiflexaceae bacterium]
QSQLVKKRITEKYFDENRPRIEKQLAALQQRHDELTAKLETAPYNETQIRSAREVCEAIRRLGEPGRARRDERAIAYDMLDVTAQITIEDGYKVAYADCILDAKRLPIGGALPNISPPWPSRDRAVGPN